MENVLYVMARSSSLNWLFWMFTSLPLQKAVTGSRQHIDRQTKLGFSPFAAGRFIFLGRGAAVLNAGSVTGTGETENLSSGTFFSFQ